MISKIMRSGKLIIGLSILLQSVHCVAQSFDHEFIHRDKVCNVYYSFIQKNDSSFIIGSVKDRRNNPVPDMNIYNYEYRLGTVTNPAGEFALWLPPSLKKGNLQFEKFYFTRFTVPFVVMFSDKKKPRTHH